MDRKTAKVLLSDLREERRRLDDLIAFVTREAGDEGTDSETSTVASASEKRRTSAPQTSAKKKTPTIRTYIQRFMTDAPTAWLTPAEIIEGAQDAGWKTNSAHAGNIVRTILRRMHQSGEIRRRGSKYALAERTGT